MLSVNDHEIKTQHPRAPRLRRFADDESGSIIVLTLFLMVVAIGMFGIAVDFMRFESRRAILQSTSDRAVLAATELDRHDGSLSQSDLEQMRRDIVIDHFTKAGFEDSIIGPIEVISSKDYASVGVKARFEMDTVLMRFLDRDLGEAHDGSDAGDPQFSKLSAPAQSTAVEGVANIEISMAVDLSGSMRELVTPEDGSAPTQTKISALHDAADAFATAVLDPKYAGKISLSLVPYSEHVNAGPDIFGQLASQQIHNFSYCPEFEAVDFNQLGLDLTKNYPQAQHFQSNPSFNGYNWSSSTNDVDNTICPKFSYEQIMPLSQNLADLRTNIYKLKPRAGTSIYLGMKWATALLDPSMQPVVNSLISAGKVDAAFAGRPAAYPVQGSATATQKVIVLMTDGENSGSSRLYDGYYNTASKRAHFSNYGLPYTRYYYQYNFSYYQNFGQQPGTYRKYTAQEGDLKMSQLCTLAKDAGVIVFAVAVEATDHGQQTMSDCASSQGHYFNASGDQLTSVFEGIAKQITELRLSL